MNAPQIADSRLPYTADALIGREAELARLDAAWTDPAQRVLVIRGIGGEGKTSLVGEWAARLSARGYDGASYFDWSFYSQGTHDQSGASAGPFVAAALTFFGGEEGAKLANSPASGRDKASKLLAYLRARRTLLILDGLEPLQYPPGPHAGRLRDDEMAVLLKGLAQNNPGLCVVTTREPVTDLVRYQNSTAPELALECLSEEAGAAVLQRLFEPATPKGVHHVQSTPAERVEIVRAVRGHALTLRLLGGFIHKSLRDVRRWREIDYAQADAEFVTNPNSPDARYGHAFKTIEAYERWLAGGGVRGTRQLAVLRVLGLFDRPAVSTSLVALRTEPVIPGLTDPLVGLSATDWNATLSDLEECGLVSVPRVDAAASGEAPLDAHPLLREYFARRLRAEHPDAWRAGHRRLFEHLCATTDEGEEPSLDALQPLYQAVVHGCHAGLQQQTRDTVYRDRIGRGDEAHSAKKLGAFASDLGAVACFFETPWARVSTALTEGNQAWLLSEAAFCLRALGRLTEALEPMRAGLQMRVQQEKWKNAAIVACNLSQSRLSLGDVPGAVADAKQAVTFADRDGDAFWRMAVRTAQADALHQSGRRDEARTLFREAERMQAEDQPQYPRLYSLQGFVYCDLLLTEPEQATWALGAGAGGTEAVRAVCRQVAARANQTLRWAEGRLLDIALDHLTLGQAALFEALLGGSDFGAARAELGSAVAGLRRAGQQIMLPRGLLARAWLRAVDGPRTGSDSAVSDLDEAWEIAERGPMPLFLADIHLHRARLFFAEVPYPWAESANGTPRGPKDDLADAKRLIEKHGYGRRKEELEDALTASRNWPDACHRPAKSPAPPTEPKTTPLVPNYPLVVVEIPKMTGSEMQQLHDALLSAFDLNSLTQMLRFQLNKNLAALVSAGPLSSMVFELIERAGREGWTAELIQAAQFHVPGNPELKRYSSAHPHLLGHKATNSTAAPPSSDPAPESKQGNVQVVNFEFTLARALHAFDEKQFLAALAELGLNVSKIRIASIRSGSVIVTIVGEAEELERALMLLQAGRVKFEVFARATALVSVRCNGRDGQPLWVASPQFVNQQEPAMSVVTKTVVQVDLVGYSTIAAQLDQGLGVETSAQLDQQIQQFVDAGLKATARARADTVKRTTGDGAQLVFDTPSQAHTFADALHRAARAHNAGKQPGIGKRVFRIGVATGELAIDPPGGIAESAGMTIVRAARLESSADPGGVLCDPATFAGLTTEQQERYGRRETVAGKRGETFDAHRCVLDPDGRTDAGPLAGPTAAPKPEAPPTRPPAKVDRKEILRLFDKLKSHQYDDLVFGLEIPTKLLPAPVLDLAGKKSAILKWATEENELGTLLELLHEMVEPGDANRPQ